MKGKVKFFRENDGYGFIIGEDHKEYYFNVRSIKDFEGVPKMGDIAEFEVKTNSSASKTFATNVTITKPMSEDASDKDNLKQGKEDSRMVCPHCGKKMVPRVTFTKDDWGKSSPDAAFCPFCGGQVKEFEKKKYAHLMSLIVFLIVLAFFLFFGLPKFIEAYKMFQRW